MDTWTLQAGYPLLTVSWDEGGGVNVSQSRFLLCQENASDPNAPLNAQLGYAWYVPLTYLAGGNGSSQTAMLWMNLTDGEWALRNGVLPTWHRDQ